MAGAADEWAALGCGGAVAAGSGGGDDAGGGGPAGVDAAAAAVLAVPAERKNRWLSSCLSGALLIPPAPTTASPRGGGSGGGGGGGAAAAVALSGELRAATLFSPSADRGRHSALPFLPLLSPGAQLLSASSSVRSSCSLEMSNSDLERGAGRSLGWQMDLQHTEREGTGSDIPFLHAHLLKPPFNDVTPRPADRFALQHRERGKHNIYGSMKITQPPHSGWEYSGALDEGPTC